MTIKSFALIAATVATAATGAAADNYFGYKGVVDSTTALDLGLVRADGAGVVEIYDYHRGEQGALLGTEMVNAGANSDVRVNVGISPYNDVLAVLKVDGQIVATQPYMIEDDS